jgi:hypothetical protein
MEDSETIYIKYHDGQAIITDNSLNDAHVKLIFNDHHWIHAETIPHTDDICDAPLSFMLAQYMEEGYTGENKETFDRFVQYVMNRINSGIYDDLILSRTSLKMYINDMDLRAITLGLPTYSQVLSGLTT